MELAAMMGCTAQKVMPARKVFAKVQGLPVRERLPVMRRPNPVIVLKMRIAMMEYFATVRRPVTLKRVVGRAVPFPVRMMGNIVPGLKVAMWKQMSA
jgi:hypothetical protein